MNHHLPAMPHGQLPMPPTRRQQDFSYNAAPPHMRSPQYMGYPPHMNGHIPHQPYSSQQYPYWYPPYGHVQGPPRPYQAPYGPMIVSSYPHSQPVMAPTHIPHSMPMHQRTPTPLQPIMSPTVLHPSIQPIQPEFQEYPAVPPHSAQGYPVASPPPRWEPQSNLPPKPTFAPPIPWLSVPEQPFPARIPRRRRKGRVMQSSVELPTKDTHMVIERGENEATQPSSSSTRESSEPHTPTTATFQQSDADSTQPTTPSSIARSQAQSKGSKPAPVIPVVPNVPSTPRRQAKDGSVASGTPKSTEPATPAPVVESDKAPSTETKTISPVPAAPKSWADLVRSKESARAASAAAAAALSEQPHGLPAQKNKSLADVLSKLGEDVTQYSDKIAFLEPRGLVNTGNMCYMNSVLQILVSCTPFYQFLDHLGRRAAHTFHSDLPLIDAMIMFMKEFRVIDAATSEEQLRLRLKPNELEQYGDSFVPEFVYEMVRQLPRFRDMRRGHQQDAQEFLGFLLEEMHEECARAETHTATKEGGDSSADGWLEVGHKQKAAVTQLSGSLAAESPVTRIFGGKLRSEFKVPGNKTSVTLEPYQPLQLDIGSHDVHNILDALRGMTKPESIQGDFNSSRGPNITATKQIFIETLPPVLILHLKRFQYDSATGATQKIWKKVGYPLDLELPREVFPPHRRNAMASQRGPPKYRLMGVIYHHGKNASGGHYTVDVRRQEGLEWIRMDDTVIRRVRSEEVAEAGGEEDPKVLAAALEQHKHDKVPNGNIFDHIDQDDMELADSDKGWSQVNGNGANGHASKKSVNGVTPPPAAASGVRTPLGRYGSRDNKVAYLLFYQRMD